MSIQPEEESFIFVCDENKENNKKSESTSGTSIDDLKDFKAYNKTDLVYREYEDIQAGDMYLSEGYQNFEECEPAHWKQWRPTPILSWCRSIVHSFLITVLAGGTFVGIFSSTLMWFALNTSELCYDYTDKWYSMPLKIQHTRITTHALKSMIIQFWHFYCILFIFGFPLVKEVNLLSWNMLASLGDAIYRLFIYIYYSYSFKSSTYPANAIFAAVTMFNGLRVAKHYYSSEFKKRLMLAFKLGAQFYFGIPIALLMNYTIIPYYKTLSETNKVILASLAPATVIIPKAITRISAENLKDINHPGTSVLLILPFQVCTAVVFRVLQAGLNSFAPFFASCVIHGLEGTVDKLTLALRDFVLHKCCVRQYQSLKQFKNPRVNRIWADLAIVSMIVEGAAIFLSCATVQVFRYYYGRQGNGKKLDGHDLFNDFLWRVTLAIIIEFVFNTISIKIQTYYYNIPIMRVWKKRWRWILGMILLHTTVAMLYFSEYLFEAVRSREMYNQSAVRRCVGPFQRP